MEAATWREAGISARDASYWTPLGVTDGHLAKQWNDLGVDWSNVEGLVRSGMSPADVQAAAQEMGVSIIDTGRLLEGTRGDVNRAQEARPLLSRFPESSNMSDELVNILQTDFTIEGTLKLLDQGVPPGEFWGFAKLGLTEAQVTTVVEHGGIPVFEMTHAFKCGYSADEIIRLAAGVKVFGDIVKRPNLSLYFAASSGIDPDDLTAENAHQFLLEERQLRRSYGLKEEQGFGGCGPDGYLAAGIVTGFVEWFDRGISPAAAKLFRSADVDAADALELLTKGHTPPEIVEAAESAGLDVLRQRNAVPLPWTTYFSRSRAAGFDFTVSAKADWGRFYDALNALAVPHSTNVAMYSDRVEEWVFLDGGVTAVSKYGFSGSSGVWVTGPLALTFLCGRLGLEPPHRHGGNLLQVTHDELEDRLQTQRRDWPTMAGQLQKMFGRSD